MRLSFYAWTLVSLLAASSVAAQATPPDTTTSPSDESAKIEACRQQLDACVRAAEAPESIDSCSEQEARCIATAMQVSVPEGTSTATLTQCAADATDCSLAAYTTEQFNSCARSLASCINGVADSKLTCNDRWTQCVSDQPWLLALCSLELLGCTDP